MTVRNIIRNVLREQVGGVLDRYILGLNLVKNGNFTFNTSWWTAGSGATLSIVNEQMNVQNGGGDAYSGAYQTLSVVIGRTYRLTAKVESTTGTAEITLTNTTLNEAGLSAGEYTYTFTSSVTNPSLRLASRGVGTLTIFDNASVREVL